MIRDREVSCYSVALVSQVIEGKENNLSLINLIEGVNVPAVALGATLPFEIVSGWLFSGDLLGRPVETRAVIVDLNGEEAASSIAHLFDVGGDPTVLPSGRIRGRIRLQGLPLPKAFGEYQVNMSWRFPDGEWQVSEPYWLFTLGEHVVPESTQSPD